MSALFYLVQRELIRFFRQPSRVLGSLLTPLLVWFLVGGGFGTQYFIWFLPGVVVMSVLFTAIFSTMSVIEDRHQGFLQGVLISPCPRWVVVLSKIIGGTVIGLMQGLLLLAADLFLLPSFSWASIFWAVILLTLMGMALTSLGFYFAWKLDSVQGYHGIMNMVLMPMWMLSGAIFPVDGAHPIMKAIMFVNPLSYGVPVFRDLISNSAILPQDLALALLVTSLFAVVTLVLGLRVARYQ